MSVLRRLRPALLLAAIAVTASAAVAADPAAAPATPAKSTAPATPPGYSDRLFLSFAQDAALVPSQWWEGQIEYDNGSSDIPVDVLLVKGVVAFRPVKNLEVGGNVGFGSSNSSQNRPDGTGATDLNAYGKWVFKDAGQNLDFSVGGIFTIPTGDDTAGLGFNSFATQAFGGVRYRMQSAIIGGHIGVRYNGDGEFQGNSLNGKVSYEMAFSALFPLANQVSLVAEADVETDRFENLDASTQILGGINWKAFGRGMLRGAVSFGLTNGAPDFRVLAGYAYTF